jgi:hypothetical protein
MEKVYEVCCEEGVGFLDGDRQRYPFFIRRDNRSLDVVRSSPCCDGCYSFVRWLDELLDLTKHQKNYPQGTK